MVDVGEVTVKVRKIEIQKRDLQNLTKWATVSGRSPEHELAMLIAAERVRRKEPHVPA